MNPVELIDFIRNWAPDLEFIEEETQYPTVYVTRQHAKDFLTKLRDNSDTKFDFLFCLTGVDYPKHLEVVYHLESTEIRHVLVVKTKTDDRDNPILSTVSDIYPTAEFHEREVYDLLGIAFDGHPNMKRIFLADEWVGHPLRKDYVDDKNMVIK